MKFPTYEDKDGTNLAEVGTDCMKLIRDSVRMVSPVRQEPDRPGSNVPKQPTVPPMPKGFKTVDVKRGATIKRPVTGMPSAEPEIIRCKDCKYWDTTWQNDYAPNYHYCPMIDGTRRNDFYCADAERRPDG